MSNTQSEQILATTSDFALIYDADLKWMMVARASDGKVLIETEVSDKAVRAYQRLIAKKGAQYMIKTEIELFHKTQDWHPMYKPSVVQAWTKAV